jgi:hypothetical protein
MINDLHLEFALKGDLEKWARETTTGYLTGLKGAVKEAGLEVQTKLRDDVTSAGLGQGLANAWRLDVNPRGAKLAYSPSAYLHSNAAHIIEGFTKGEPLASRDGGYLAVPIPGSPADEVRVPKGGKLIAIMEKRFGKLRTIRTKRGLLMLVAENVRQSASGRFGSAVRTNKKTGTRYVPKNAATATLPLFWLVRQVRLAKRLNWPTIAKEAEGQFASTIESKLKQRLSGASAAGGAPAGGVPAGWD